MINSSFWPGFTHVWLLRFLQSRGLQRVRTLTFIRTRRYPRDTESVPSSTGSLKRNERRRTMKILTTLISWTRILRPLPSCKRRGVQSHSLAKVKPAIPRPAPSSRKTRTLSSTRRIVRRWSEHLSIDPTPSKWTCLRTATGKITRSGIRASLSAGSISTGHEKVASNQRLKHDRRVLMTRAR